MAEDGGQIPLSTSLPAKGPKTPPSSSKAGCQEAPVRPCPNLELIEVGQVVT